VQKRFCSTAAAAVKGIKGLGEKNYVDPRCPDQAKMDGNGVAPLAMPRRWRTVQKKNKRKRFRDRRATFTTVYVVDW
jgi:hypothetical protein